MPVYLPPVNFAQPPASPVVAASSINDVSVKPSESQLTLAAQNAPLRILYGLVRVGAQVANVIPWGNFWVIQAVWGEGEIQSIESIQFGDQTVPAGVVTTHYLGAAVQAIDSTLLSAFASNGVAFSDGLHGIAYSVFKIPVSVLNSFPQITAVIKGRKVRNPGNATAWSDNPALCLADFIESPLYGLGRTVNDASLIAARDACDTLISGAKKRTIGLALESPQQTTQWIDILRTYAGCWALMEGAEIILVPDQARATDASFIHANGQILKIGNLKRRGVAQVPTVLEVRYTDVSKFPWREESVFAYAGNGDSLPPGVVRRDSQIALPGIQSAAQAKREAIERLNKLWLADLSFTAEVFDEGVKLQLGDVVEITHPIGLGAKKMRVLGISGDYGRFTLDLMEYDPAVYSSAVVGSPTYPDTNLPSPADPPAVTGLTATEEVYQLENGLFASRIRLSWDLPSWPYMHDYSIRIEQAANVIDMRRQTATTYASPSVQEGLTYVCKVAIISSIGAIGTTAQANITPLGKFLIPTDIASMSGFEAGGRVYLNWTPSIDIDIFRYEVRYGLTAGSWGTAQLIDRVDALRLSSDQIPVGTWKFYVKALDSVGQYSVNPATVIITVTSDASAFLVDSYNQTNPALTNMANYTLAPYDSNLYTVTEDGALVSSKFIGSLSGYVNIMATYHASVTSTWLGEAEDFGLLLGGQWTGTATVNDISGTHISYIGLSNDSVGWTYFAGLSQKQNARFARIKHESLTTSTMQVVYPDQNIKLEAIPRNEKGSGTSSASGPVTVFLTNDYVQTKKISISPESATAVTYSYDNVGRNELNPQDKASSIVLTNTNNITSTTPNIWETVRARHPIPSTGKWYWECNIDAGGTSNRIMIGVMSRTESITNSYPGATATGVGYAGETGNRFINGAGVAFGATYTTNDVIGMAYDSNLGTLAFYKNNTLQGTVTGLSGEKFPAFGIYYANSSMTARFISTALSYSPPAGYVVFPYAFDVNIFNTSGSRVVRDFLWEFEGV